MSERNPYRLHTPEGYVIECSTAQEVHALVQALKEPALPRRDQDWPPGDQGGAPELRTRFHVDGGGACLACGKSKPWPAFEECPVGTGKQPPIVWPKLEVSFRKPIRRADGTVDVRCDFSPDGPGRGMPCGAPAIAGAGRCDRHAGAGWGRCYFMRTPHDRCTADAIGMNGAGDRLCGEHA